MARKGDSSSGRKTTYQEKGKRKMDETPTSASPSTRARTHVGIHIGERPSPHLAPSRPSRGKPTQPEMGFSTSPNRGDRHLRNFHSTEEEDEFIANGYLPYAMYLTRLFKHFGINLKNETPIKTTTYDVIGISTLRRMRYKLHQGEWLMQSEIDIRRQAAQGSHPSQQEHVGEVQTNGGQMEEGLVPRSEVEAQMGGDGNEERRNKALGSESLTEPDPPSPFHYP